MSRRLRGYPSERAKSLPDPMGYSASAVLVSTSPFAIALLDSLGNGVVVSSLHSRTDTRVFAKPVQSGRSKFQLSDEEQDAIRKALAPTS